MSTQRAEQPGAVVRHVARVGDVVRVGDPVLVVETMKFESTVVAHSPGVVGALAPLGDVVAVGSTLCDIRSFPEALEGNAVTLRVGFESLSQRSGALGFPSTELRTNESPSQRTTGGAS